MSKLHDMLVAGDKKKIFNFDNTPSIGYPSGLLPLDYSNAYWARVNNDGKPNVPNKWLNMGTQGGSFYTIIGNSGVAKTTLAVQMGSAEIRNFELGDYYHIDAEGTSNATRVQTLNKFSDEEMLEKYHFPEIIYVEDAFTMIYKLAQFKINDKAFAYHTGCYDMRGDEIVVPQPTVVLIDSLPSLQTKDVEDSDSLGSQTYNMRLAIAYNTFYKRLRPIIRNANITVMAINHIKEKPEMGFIKTQAKIQYLKPSESIVGGSGPIYYSQNLLRMIYRGKFVSDKDGFDGFLVEAFNIKSKTNKSGTSVHLVFNADCGFEPMLTLLHFADEAGLICGRNPYCYLKGDPDLKFSTKDVNFIMNDERFAKALVAESTPLLMKLVNSTSTPSNSDKEDMDPSELMSRIDDAFKINEAGKDDLITKSDRELSSASMFKYNRKNVPDKEVIDEINASKLYAGVHRYGKNVKKKPAIEKFLKNDNYLKYSIMEMHTPVNAFVI